MPTAVVVCGQSAETSQTAAGDQWYVNGQRSGVMEVPELGREIRQAIEHVLGYLNFSSGAPDAAALASLNCLFRAAECHAHPQQAAWRVVHEWLRTSLPQLAQQSATFRDAEQARYVLALTFNDCLPAYFNFHRDLLF